MTPSETPLTDALQDRCLKSVRIFERESSDKLRDLPRLLGDLSYEMLMECRQLERQLAAAREALRERVQHATDCFGYTMNEMDVEAFINMRDWLEQAVTAKGAKCDGSGIGMGRADIDIELEGFRYNIAIRPLPPQSHYDKQLLAPQEGER